MAKLKNSEVIKSPVDKKKNGRPSKQNQPTLETISEKFLSGVKLGLSEKTACELAGISEQSLNRWKKKDAAFGSAIKTAHAESKAWWCIKLRQAAEVAASKGGATPMMFWLSRRTEEFRENPMFPLPQGKRLIIEDE